MSCSDPDCRAVSRGELKSISAVDQIQQDTNNGPINVGTVLHDKCQMENGKKQLVEGITIGDATP